MHCCKQLTRRLTDTKGHHHATAAPADFQYVDAHKGAALVIGADTADTGGIIQVASLCRSLMQRGAALRVELPASKARSFSLEGLHATGPGSNCPRLPACRSGSWQCAPPQGSLAASQLRLYPAPCPATLCVHEPSSGHARWLHAHCAQYENTLCLARR